MSMLWSAPMPSSGKRYQVSGGGSVSEPRWLNDQEVVYLSAGESSYLFRVRAAVDTSGGAPSTGRSAWMALPGFVDTAGQSYQTTPDGRILYVRAADDPPKTYLRVVPDWVTQMKRAVDETNR